MSDVTADVSQLNLLAVDLAAAGPLAGARAALHVNDTAKDVVEAGQALAPFRSGNLRDSITYEMAGDGLSAEAGPEAWYGHFSEGGTATQAPRPYMGPALDANDGPFVEGMARIGERIWLGS